jgi:zinc transporter 2
MAVDHCHEADKPADKVARNQLIIVSILCFLFMMAEIIGGIVSGSLAIATDATHMASDLAGFLISLFALQIGQEPATKRFTFGFYRAEVIGALASVLLVWVVTVILVVLAVLRIRNATYVIEPTTMLVTSLVGVVFNIAMGAVLHFRVCKGCRISHGHSHGGHSHGSHSHGSHSHGSHSHDAGDRYHGSVADDALLLLSDDGTVLPTAVNGYRYRRETSANQVTAVATIDHCDASILPYLEPCDQPNNKQNTNINVRAAMVHVIGDFIQSFGVVIAAIVIKVKPEYKLADPICTFIFSFLVLCSTVFVLRDICLIILEAVPGNVSYHAIKEDLKRLAGVIGVHSLNVWSLTMDKVVVTVHLAVAPGVGWPKVLAAGRHLLRHKYKVHHSTIQVEHYDEDVMSECHKCLSP